MTDDFANDFKRDRNEALRSLDEAKIRAYGKKYGCWMSDDPTVFWASVHKARAAISSIPEEERELSLRWLRDHKMRPLP